MAFPEHVRYLVVGAGVHGLSTAYHLALELAARGKGGGDDILVIDKTGIAAGASGIACGVVRNNYFQPAMRSMSRAVALTVASSVIRGSTARRTSISSSGLVISATSSSPVPPR